MPEFLTPLHEFNKCHAPAGSPAGGQFCATPGGFNRTESSPISPASGATAAAHDADDLVADIMAGGDRARQAWQVMRLISREGDLYKLTQTKLVTAQRAAKAAAKTAYRQEFKDRASAPAAEDAVKSVGRETDKHILSTHVRSVVTLMAQGRAHGAPKKYRDAFVPAFVSEWDRRHKAAGGGGLN